MYFLFLAVFLSVPFYAQGTKRAENTASGRGLSPFHGKKPYPILII